MAISSKYSNISKDQAITGSGAQEETFNSLEINFFHYQAAFYQSLFGLRGRRTRKISTNSSNNTKKYKKDMALA